MFQQSKNKTGLIYKNFLKENGIFILPKSKETVSTIISKNKSVSCFLNDAYFIYKKIKVYYNLCIGVENMAEMKISAVYKITNTVTGDFYIGSSKNVRQRWAVHKCQSTWKNYPNKQLYKDMMKYGVDKFELQILEEVEADKLKELEQQFIETLKPTYNRCNAKGLNVERRKETHKKASRKYEKSDKRKKAKKEYNKEYHKTDKYKEYQKEYQQSDKYKEYQKEFYKEYNSQLCCYNGELLKLCALSKRFQRAGIPHPQLEAKKYLVL